MAGEGNGGRRGRGWPAWLLGAVGLALLGWLMWQLERSMLYFPTRLGNTTPATWGIPYADARIATPDGETLGGWWCARPEPGAPVLLFLHGNAGNREDRLHNVAGLWRAGISVLIIDYRGYGDSTGRPEEDGLYRDGAAAFDWLAERVGGRPIALFGRSLGGAVAARVALERPVARLVLESTFTSAREMARRMLPLPGIDKLVRSRFDTLAAVERLTVPLLVIHGEADEMIPFAMGQALHAAAGSADKTLRAVPGGHHNDTYLVAGEAYWGWLRDFLGAPGAGPGGGTR